MISCASLPRILLRRVGVVIVTICICAGCEQQRTTRVPLHTEPDINAAALDSPGARVFVRVVIDGGKRTERTEYFLVDTGASRTVLSPSLFADKSGFAKENVVGLGGERQVDWVRVAQLAVGDKQVKQIKCFVTDAIEHKRISVKGVLVSVEGVLGQDFLQRYRATIDLARSELILQ